MTKGEVVKNQDNTLLLQKAKTYVAQRLLGGAVLVFLGFMLFNTAKTTFAVDTLNSNLNVTIGAGVLEMLNTEAMVNFAAGTAGTASNVFGNLDLTVIRDFRAAGMGNWDVNIYSGVITGVTDTNFTIPNTSISVWPANTTFGNLESYDTALLGTGVGTRALDGDNIFFNSDEGTTGAVVINNILFKVNLNASLDAQDYRGTTTLTVVAS
ncbi:MAG: hypothetical protein WC553_00105 [Patescibacteria group bacterium]